jgi:peroxidase
MIKTRSLMKSLLAGIVLLSTAPVALGITPRTIDGSNNNLANPAWGQTFSHELRLTPADYVDGIGIIRTDIHGRPNARAVSTAIFSQSATESILDENNLSEMTWAWGQFIDHDVDITSDGAEPHQITIPPSDPDFAFDSDGLITLSRKAYAPGTGTSTTNPRQYNNEITTWLDASLVYGSDAGRASALRTNAGLGAKLRTHEYGNPSTDRDNLLPTAQDLIDAGVPVPVMAMENNPRMGDDVRFIAGDVRANENTAILGLHTLMAREHNRIVDILAAADPGLAEEDLYQIARKVIGAEMQAVTYNEYLPTIGVNVDTSGGYDTGVDPSISAEFAHAVFRMGHSSVNELALRLNDDLTAHPLGPISLEDTFFNPAELFDSGGIEPFLLGLISNVQEATDIKMVPGLRNGLFQIGPTNIINDLAAIDIERGRDIGLGDYNEVREAVGLSPVTDFDQITSDPELQSALSSLYGGEVNDIDLFVAMLAEDHLPGVSSGITIQRVLEEQFERMAVGDSFFYEWDADLAMIEATYGIPVLETLAEIMLANTDIPGSSITNENVYIAQPVPEPTAMALIAVSFLAIGALRKRVFGLYEPLKRGAHGGGVGLSTDEFFDGVKVNDAASCGQF